MSLELSLALSSKGLRWCRFSTLVRIGDNQKSFLLQLTCW